MPGTYDRNQATGARAQIITGKESDWGVAPTDSATAYREHPVIGGETLDENITTYRSNVIRSDRMRNPTVRGTRRPGGSLPYELAAKGVAHFFWDALGTDITTTDNLDGTWTHVIKGGVSLPVGRTIQKGFLDLDVPQFIQFLGGRCGGFNMNLSVDQVVGGAFDYLFRSSVKSGTSLAANPVTAPVVSPFTSVQAVLNKDGTQLAVCQSFSLNYTNNLYGDTGFVLGSNFRQNLKPGTREVSGQASFLFDNMELYNAAVDGTEMALELVCTDADGFLFVMDLPRVQLLPNNSSPKIESDGPMVIPASFEALRDDTLETDIQISITNDEESIEV